jgi:HemY protein
MRAALWLLGLFGISVALALFAGSNQSTITLFWPPYRVDLSLNFVIFSLIIGFVVLHLALRALSSLLSMPGQARRWRAQQRERAMYAGLIESIAHYSAGRFTRARNAAVGATERALALKGTEGEPANRPKVEALAHLYASESAHSLRDVPRREEHWQRAMELCQGKDAQELREAAILRSARWLIDDRNAQGCLSRLGELPQGAARRTLALRLKLRAARLCRETQLALDTARLLAKHRAFSPEASQSILRGLISDLLDNAHDLDQLSRAWKQLDAAEKADTDLALLGARKFVQLSRTEATSQEQAIEMARQCLQPVWANYATLGHTHRRKLALAMEQAQVGQSRNWLQSIEQSQSIASTDPVLQYIAANACADQALWGKAMQWLKQCAPALADASLARRAWLALSKLAGQGQDRELEIRALERAAELLD